MLQDVQTICIIGLILATTAELAFFNFTRRVGGLYHWRVGRVGGSFYLARRR